MMLAVRTGARPCHYDVLGVNPACSDDDIKKAYRKLALTWHPDKIQDKREDTAEVFRLITEAYKILRDPEKRQMYDRYGHQGPDEAKNEEGNATASEVRPTGQGQAAEGPSPWVAGRRTDVGAPGSGWGYNDSLQCPPAQYPPPAFTHQHRYPQNSIPYVQQQPHQRWPRNGYMSGETDPTYPPPPGYVPPPAYAPAPFDTPFVYARPPPSAPLAPEAPAAPYRFFSHPGFVNEYQWTQPVRSNSCGYPGSYPRANNVLEPNDSFLGGPCGVPCVFPAAGSQTQEADGGSNIPTSPSPQCVSSNSRSADEPSVSTRKPTSWRKLLFPRKELYPKETRYIPPPSQQDIIDSTKGIFGGEGKRGGTVLW